MKIFTTTFGTETNTFCTIPTTRANFESEYFTHGGGHDETLPHAWAEPLVVFAKLASERGWQCVESICTGAQPAGPVVKQDYETLRDIILHDLQQAMPVDMVFLNLHGAMVAEGYDDCEGDIIARVRSLVGDDIPIAVQLDPHGHLTTTMTENASVIMCYKNYPHTDVSDIAEDLFHIMVGVLENKVKPVMVSYDCRVINVYPTLLEPMKSFMTRLRALEAEKDVLAISIVHCFPWGDVPDLGTKVIVVTDNNQAKAEQLAKTLGDELIELKHQTRAPSYSLEQALELVSKSQHQPIVLADIADNSGGGAPGDSTFILQRLLEQGVANVALGVIWDPIAVEIACSVGVGGHLPLRIGGKTNTYSGNPIDVEAEVMSINPELTISFGRGMGHFGRAVCLNVAGIEIVLATLRLQTYTTECFTKLDIDLAKKSLIVVKSAEHFRESFSKVSQEIISVNTAGALCSDFTLIPYKKVKRPIWPLDETASPKIHSINVTH